MCEEKGEILRNRKRGIRRAININADIKNAIKVEEKEEDT
jgi:hypothetical protein